MIQRQKTWSTHTNTKPLLLVDSKSGPLNFLMKKGTKRKETEKTSTFPKLKPAIDLFWLSKKSMNTKD